RSALHHAHVASRRRHNAWPLRVLGRDDARRGRQRRSQNSRTALHRGVLPMRRRWLMRFHQAPVRLVAVLGLARSVGAAEPVTLEYWYIKSPTIGVPAAKRPVQ